eukprot:1107927-Rhodomonas_salina.3
MHRKSQRTGGAPPAESARSHRASEQDSSLNPAKQKQQTQRFRRPPCSHTEWQRVDLDSAVVAVARLGVAAQSPRRPDRDRAVTSPTRLGVCLCQCTAACRASLSGRLRWEMTLIIITDISDDWLDTLDLRNCVSGPAGARESGVPGARHRARPRYSESQAQADSSTISMASIVGFH